MVLHPLEQYQPGMSRHGVNAADDVGQVRAKACVTEGEVDGFVTAVSLPLSDYVKEIKTDRDTIAVDLPPAV